MKKQLSPDELKRCELDILKDVARFCDEHNIHNSLTFGTLLCAIRYSSFIPWENDIDIAVPRDECNDFAKNYTYQWCRGVAMCAMGANCL